MTKKCPFTISEALETLTAIADVHEFNEERALFAEHDFAIDEADIAYHAIYWLQEKNADKTVKSIKKIYHVILDYLQDFYKKDSNLANQKVLERIKAIMALVGEDTRKLNQKCSEIFQGAMEIKVYELKEYRELKNFYVGKILKNLPSDMGMHIETAGIEEIVMRGGEKAPSQMQDLDSVKQDKEYELFYLRKEDGGHFFSPELMRNLNLICDFDGTFHEYAADDPLVHVRSWYDKSLQIAAKDILSSVSSYIAPYYREAMKFRGREVVRLLNEALMALMLSANPHNLIRNSVPKSCYHYFSDFLSFLRQTVTSLEYQRLISYPAPDHFSLIAINLTHSLAEALYTHKAGRSEISEVMQDLVQRGYKALNKAPSKLNVSQRLLDDLEALEAFFKQHPNGPFFKAFDILQEEESEENQPAFDPIAQDNIPHRSYDLMFDEAVVSLINMPSPSYQTDIHKAAMCPEFRSFLRSYAGSKEEKRHLVINLQDRTSWREHARCELIEGWQRQAEFAKHLVVVTLTKDSDFYNQSSPYVDLKGAKEFMKHFTKQLTSSKCGFYFPSGIAKVLFPEWIEHAFQGVHRVFFLSKGTLSRSQRLDFIEIVYFLLELKLIEIVEPKTFSLVCKDGVDVGSTSSAGLSLFLSFLKGVQIGESSIQKLHELLFVPALLVRERAVLADRYQRIISAVAAVEKWHQVTGDRVRARLIDQELAPLYDTHILSA